MYSAKVSEQQFKSSLVNAVLVGVSCTNNRIEIYLEDTVGSGMYSIVGNDAHYYPGYGTSSVNTQNGQKNVQLVTRQDSRKDPSSFSPTESSGSGYSHELVYQKADGTQVKYTHQICDDIYSFVFTRKSDGEKYYYTTFVPTKMNINGEPTWQ